MSSRPDIALALHEIALLRNQLAAARGAIEAAVCADCSEQIGVEDWLVNSDGKLVHTRCAFHD